MNTRRLAALLIVGAIGCARRPQFTEALMLGGQTVPPETLNEGHDAYMHYCHACHGEKGDGRGPSSPGMRPPPRDFRTGMFKFGGVAAGEMPHDVDLLALIKNGLDGTPMLPWDLSDRERHAVLQYIKTFSDRWKTETPGERLLPPLPDPWVGKEAEAVERGRRLYHLSGVEKDAAGNPTTFFLSCNECHPSYLTRDDLSALSQKVLGVPPKFRDDLFRPVLKDGDYLAGDYKVHVLPVDFLFHPVKNGTSLQALYRTIAAGIAGASMPTWSSIKADDLWALVHYVKTLTDLRGTPQATVLQAALGLPGH